MKFGIPIGNFGTFGKNGGAKDIVAVAERAELLGYDSVWLHDHIFMPARIKSRYPYNESGVAGFAYRQDIYDPLAMMAAVAVRTKRVSIGTSVLIIPYRNPLVLAKMLSTLDHLSKGRILLGIGVGWMQEEFEALGIGGHYPIRGRVTDEWMRICIEIWTCEGAASFDGEFHRFSGLGVQPQPVQKPHIPIWVGGKREIAVRRTARYGQGYHTITSSPAEVKEEIRLLHEALEQAGRDPSEIEVSMLGPLVSMGAEMDASAFPAVVSGSRQEVIDKLGEYQEAGLEHALAIPTLGAPGLNTRPQVMMEAMQALAEDVMPALR